MPGAGTARTSRIRRAARSWQRSFRHDRCAESLNGFTVLTPHSILRHLLGRLEVVTLPAGTKVEEDDFLQAAGLANVFLRGHRVMVMTRDLLALASLTANRRAL